MCATAYWAWRWSRAGTAIKCRLPTTAHNAAIARSRASTVADGSRGNSVTMKAPSYRGLTSRSQKATAAARGSSRKSDTRCEILLRKQLWRLGLRYRVNVRGLPGNPDIVFRKAKVVVFVDGDFWHGRNLRRRLRQLAKGHNPEYWTRKVRANVARDRRVTRELQRNAWRVIRVWESDIRQHTDKAVARITRAVRR